MANALSEVHISRLQVAPAAPEKDTQTTISSYLLLLESASRTVLEAQRTAESAGNVDRVKVLERQSLDIWQKSEIAQNLAQKAQTETGLTSDDLLHDRLNAHQALTGIMREVGNDQRAMSVLQKREARALMQRIAVITDIENLSINPSLTFLSFSQPAY